MASKTPKPRAKAKAKTGAPAAPDPLAAVRRRVAKKLEGFTADFPEDVDRWAMSGGRPDAAAFPVPELVLFLFRNLMGWRWSGHGEKVRWSVHGSVNGEPVDRIGEGRSFTGKSLEPADADRTLRLLADHAGEVVTRDSPRISATLPETGERFQGAFMPVVSSPAFAIRKRPEVVFTLPEYVEQCIMTEGQAEVIREAVTSHQNILIVGGTGSGKTTLANAILAEPAFAQDRVIIIEDTAELQCSAADQIQMLIKRTDPPVTMTDLVRDTLRLRPDRIIIGEVRDGSALDLLKAWNTGHPGGLATIHANSAAEGLTRLEDLIGEVTQRIPYRAITQAINVIIYIERTPTGRRVKTVSRLVGRQEDTYQVEAVADR